MKLNAYTLSKISLVVTVYKKESNINDVLRKALKDNYVFETKESFFVLGKEKLPDTWKTKLDFIELPSYIQNQFIKNIFKSHLISAGFHCVKPHLFLIPEIKAKEMNHAFINTGFEFKVESLNDSFYIVITPKNIITVDGKEYDSQFAKEKSKLLINNLAIKYKDYFYRFNWIIRKLGESFQLSVLDCGFIEFSPYGDLNSECYGHFPEPSITFGGGREHTYPAAGLKKFFPLDYNESSAQRPNEIESAFIGTKSCKEIFEVLKSGKNGVPSFEDVYKCKIKFPKECCFVLNSEEIQSCKSIDDITELLTSKAKKITNIRKSIKLCIIELPYQWEQYFSDHEKDLHDEIKVAFWQERIPTQIITRKAKETYGSNKYDNLALGIYVTAGGKPWKLAKQFKNTTYIGIAFGQVIENKKRLIGVAEVFDEFGYSISMQCMSLKSIELAERFADKDYHLSKDMIYEIINNLLNDYYKSQSNNWPSEVVIHKTSFFNNNELLGLESFNDYPFSIRTIHVSSSSNWCLLKNGVEPQRGLYWVMNNNIALLYTSGVLQNSNKYFLPGMPNPLLVNDQSKISNIKLACQEIMHLTKLNWNSTNSFEREPVTISHARKIINLLRAGLPESGKIPIDIRYFL